VLDDDDGLAGVHQPVEEPEQLLDVGEVQAGARLVEHVDAALLGEMRGELEPLPFAAREGREGLADREVTEADVGETTEDRVRGRNAGLSGLCSTTSTVLPLSRRRSSSSFIRWMSCGCRPTVGSSNTYVTSVSDEPRWWRIIFVRWASPPESVPDERASDR
jgi:hypothetical protein